jgi:hypothetical protein
MHPLAAVTLGAGVQWHDAYDAIEAYDRLLLQIRVDATGSLPKYLRHSNCSRVLIVMGTSRLQLRQLLVSSVLLM